MKKLERMIRGAVTTAMVCGTVLYTGSDTCQAAGNPTATGENLIVGEVYSTALEAAYGDTFHSVYENYPAGSPLESENADGVDTATGHLMLSRTDLSLDGTGGMDFELNRYYDSNEANLGHATVEYVDELKRDAIWVEYTAEDGTKRELIVNRALLANHKNALKNLIGTSYTEGREQHKDVLSPEGGTQRTKIVSNEGHNVYGLASGWRYDFPWIETVTLTGDAGWGKNPARLHYGHARVMNIVTEADDTTKSYRIKGLENYGYNDIRLEDWDRTVDGIACKYLLRDKTGLRTYFNEDGVIVLQKDAHGNTITFTYTDNIYFSRITDSVGREIVFHYSGDEGEKVLTSVTVQGKETGGGVSRKTVTYETEEHSYTPLYGDRLHGVTLASATVDGSKEKYSYKTVERLVNTSGAGVASQRVSTNESYLLESITAEGSETHYEYRAGSLRGSKNTGTGQERDVVTEQFYVTREYERDPKTGKKSEGIKYDYFQKKGEGVLLSYDDFREREKKEDGSDGEIYEAWQYGNSGLRTVTVASSFNPNKYKTNGKYYDYTYKKSKIDPETLRLRKDTKKNVTLYIYNENKLLTGEISYGTEKQETLYTYDKDGKGSLVVQETQRSFGKKGKDTVTSQQGYTYDVCRNLLTSKGPRAYLKKNKGKEYLYTTTYTYHATDKGYPAGDAAALLSILAAQESYSSASTKVRTVGTVASNSMDYASISEQRSVNGGAYKTISRTDFQYDARGNETQGKACPSYGTDGEKEVIRNDYTYNSLGQQTKTTVTITSAKRPADDRTYTEEEVTYDSFGNELTCTDENGLVSKTSYDPETGEETETIDAVGTEYETTEREYRSADGLKSMTVDNYGRVTITIQDAFGNTILSKDEAAGTWTESIYDYGSEPGDGGNVPGDDGDGDPDEEKEETARLTEERTWSFEPDEKRFIVNENGEKVPNYYITGKGKDILSGSRHFYDNLGNETGSAEFSNGELDAAHCTSWSFSRSETEVTGEGDEAQSISTSYSKEINPSAYQETVDAENYYNQFDDAVLTETITETVTDAEGNTVSQKTTTIRGKNTLKTVTTYETDDFGRTTQEDTVTRKQQDGKWLPAYEMQTLSAYDDNGNVCQTETRSRKEGETEWQTRTVRTDYDEQGQVTGEYTPRGTRENVATKYEYDILGQMIRSEIPQEKTDGSIVYQKTTTEYDNAGNVTEKSEQVDSDRTAKTEYTYDKQGNLVMVKSCPGDGNFQYVQYVYDIQGNKVRQFTGMTAPLTLAVSEVTDAADGADAFSYAGKTWQLTVSGKKKTDTIRETKYEYDGKNQLTAYTDPEGRRETYTYDENGNLTKTVDKNGNTRRNTYDYQNRLTGMVASPSQKGQEKKTGKETRHTYTYNAYGDVAAQDDTIFEYGDVSGQVTKETTRLTKNKTVEKSHTYDSADNKAAFAVKVGGSTELSLKYDYDGESRLTAVTDGEGNQVAGYSYDTDGNLSERTVPGNNMATTYTHDYQNHLTAMENRTGSAGVISRYTSEYLLNGQKSEETSSITDKAGKRTAKTAAYTYDLLGRITKETKTGSRDISYTYDSNNNRKEMTVGNKVTAYRYNKNDELLRTDMLNTDTEEDSVVIQKYDRNGNQLATVSRHEIPEEKKDRPYIDIDVTLGDNRLNENVVNHYNALDQLVQTLTKNYKASFTYDAEGLRTSKTVNGEKTVFVWDGDQVVMELSGGGKVRKRYIRGNELIYTDKGTDTGKQYYVTDPHGNVVQLTDEGGKVIKTYEYDSFGNEVKPEKKDDNPFRYCGEYYDRETGEVYLRARYYIPSAGRFLTRDSYTGEEDEPGSLHLYAYCYNNPV
ncbi:MAG: RHS repeat-associated core domain-containing protein, partial [Roseburia sp.]|nr:RHS repeat-associated core domain-containing protein [Roseburia sp.]